MSKKKKKKKEGISVLKEVDRSLNGTYDELLVEIQDMQTALAIADAKAKRKQRKKARKEGVSLEEYYKYSEERKKVREEVIGKMDSTNFLDRVYKVLSDITPIIIIIARLVASLICAILSIDKVKLNISKPTLEKMNKVYEVATAIK